MICFLRQLIRFVGLWVAMFLMFASPGRTKAEVLKALRDAAEAA